MPTASGCVSAQSGTVSFALHLIDRERLAEAVGAAGVDALRELHRERVEDSLRRMPVQREPHWTDAFLVANLLRGRRL